MLAYLKKFVKRLKSLFNSPFKKGRKNNLPLWKRGIQGGFEAFNKPKNYLLFANVLLVFFLILLSNIGVLPFEKIEDFGFFAVIFLILALYRPGWSFLFFIGTIALENINLAPESLGIAVRPYQFIGALTILAVLIRLVSRRLNFNLPKINWQDKAIMVFAVAGFVSILGAADKSLSLKYSVIILSFAALYFLARVFIQNLEDIKKILPFFLSSSAVVILYGIWQNVRFMKGFSHFETMPGRPNATFAEADWLGIYLILLLAVLYSLVYFFYYRNDKNSELKISNSKIQISNQILISNNQIKKTLLVTSYWLLITLTYILLILTVSRSAWLGAGFVTVIYAGYIIWKRKFRILQKLTIVIICSIGIVYIFNLTSFELGNRLQSTGSGLQEITVSCKNKEQVKHLEQLQQIEHLKQLEHFSCRHINLEDIEKEKAAGNAITTVYRDDPNINIRSEIYRKSWEEIKKHPILGIGWGSINNILGEDERGAGLNSSNIFLEVWLGAGALGLVSFTFVLFNVLIKGISHIQKQVTSYKLQVTSFDLFLFLSFFAILIPNLFNAGIMLGFLWAYLAIANIKQSNNETIQ